MLSILLLIMMDQTLLHLISNHTVFILDFEDSFTYNIAATLDSLGQSSIVIAISNHQLFYSWLDKIIQSKMHTPIVIIFGPGPGHPKEYEEGCSQIKKLLGKKNIFIMGICLGHQLIWKAKGHQIISAKNKLHGKVRKVSGKIFSNLKIHSVISYQRYNSLEVKILKKKLQKEDEVFYYKDSLLWSRFKGGISYQFHPESTGTSCPATFFGPVLNFLYNKSDECLSNFRRSI